MSTFIRLTDYKSSDEKEEGFFKAENRYVAEQEDFEKIPGSPIAYWVSDRVKAIFEKSKKLGDISEPRQGLATGNNDLFMRNWAEVSYNNIGFNCIDRNSAIKSSFKWFPYNKGGEFQKWYGNQDYLVNWENNVKDIKKGIYKLVEMYKNNDIDCAPDLNYEWNSIVERLNHIFKVS